MRPLFFICAVLLSLYTGNMAAQTLEPYTVEQSKDSLFHRTISYLQKNQYFIDCIDTASGFIKAKKYVKNEKLLRVTLGRRTELSIIIRPVRESDSSLSVCIYQTTLEENPFYHEEGMPEDTALYQTIVRGILDTE